MTCAHYLDMIEEAIKNACNTNVVMHDEMNQALDAVRALRAEIYGSCTKVESVKMSDLYGSLPDMTNGLSIMEYLHKIRSEGNDD
jgi:hypothetical protein